MRMNKNILLLFLGIFFNVNLFSQKSSVRGFVTDKSTGEPIMFCNVTIDGTSFGNLKQT